jgi:hypothetical protein
MTSWESAPSRTADTSLEDPPVLLDGHAIDRQDRAGEVRLAGLERPRVSSPVPVAVWLVAKPPHPAGVERYRQLRKGS